MSKVVEYQISSGVAEITLSSPENGNALNLSLLKQLSQCVKQAIVDESCRVIVISAVGADFCKGLDLECTFAQDGGSHPELFKTLRDCLTLIYSSSKPVIACVEGNVTAGGVGLVAACDLVLATENVVFMVSEVILGLIPAVIAPFILRRLTPARLRYMTLSTRGINALEAREFGLVDEVATAGMSLTLDRQLQRLFRSCPRAIAQSKLYLEQLEANDLREQTDIALNQIISWLEQPHIVEAVRTFTEGFSPPWFQKYKGKKNI